MKAVDHILKKNDTTFELYAKCPFCRQESRMVLPIEYLKRYESYEQGMGSVSRMFPMLNPVEREFLMTGYCISCQRELFDNNLTSDLITTFNRKKDG